MSLSSLLSLDQASAQRLFANGESFREYASGVVAPLQMDRDPQGNIYVANGGFPGAVDVSRVTPNGQVEFFTSLEDPDALAVDAQGIVFIGSFGGRITRVDPAYGYKELWFRDPTIGNIDGMKFSPQGDLYTVAIDRSEVYRIDPTTRQASLFADLSGIGVTGMTGIAFHPQTEDVYVGSPWENIIVRLSKDGLVLDPVFASGFSFVGHLEFDHQGYRDELYVADNGGPALYRIDMATLARETLVRGIYPHIGGIVFTDHGDLVFNRTFNENTAGELYLLSEARATLTGSTSLGGAATLDLESRADASEFFILLASAGNDGVPLIDGRTLPLSFPFLVVHGTDFDATGSYAMNFNLPSDPAFLGMPLSFCFVTSRLGMRGIHAISNDATISIQP